MKELVESFGIKNVILYIIIINIMGFCLMGLDKWKAKRNSWRIPEKTLFMVTALGGGIGTIVGMYTFRHKTKKNSFVIGLPAILILEIILLIYLSIR